MVSTKGFFITVEGVEGVGKSTLTAYITQLLTEKGIHVCQTREPGGSEIAEAIRQVLLKHYQETMTTETELLLMFAGRAQHLANTIRPALSRGEWVVCDRFTDATYAYQGGGRGYSEQNIAMLEKLVQHELRPDLTLLLDAPLTIGAQRMVQRGSKQDRFEQEGEAFFERIRQNYLQRAKEYPQRFVLIDASQTLEVVQQQIRDVLEQIIETQHA